jgi:hypothetical protein
VSATVRYRVADGRLQGDNEIVIAQPEFAPSRRGDEVRERVGLPVGTAVALLKNARDEIHLSFAVTGDVAARQFDFGDAFGAAVRKATLGALALPVSWVGKIFYTADSRIDTISIWPIAFEPGTTRMSRDIDAHAERLETFLRDAPGVALSMRPVVTVEDTAALKREAVRQRIEALAVETGQPAAGPAIAARLFAERFPDRTAPPDTDFIVQALAEEERLPDTAVSALAAQRLEVTRRRLGRRGVDPERLRPVGGVVPVEASGLGRVEFEIVN